MYRAYFPLEVEQEAIDGPAERPKPVGMSNPNFQLCYRNAAMQSLLHCATFVSWTQYHEENICKSGRRRLDAFMFSNLSQVRVRIKERGSRMEAA